MANKSMDKRALHSREIIKDSFLKELEKTTYGNMTITDLCNQAQISRSTFYQHYATLADVLAEIMDDVFSQISSLESMHSYSGIQKNPCKMPLCIFIRQNSKYKNVLTDPALSNQIIDRYLQSDLSSFIERMLTKTSMSKKQLESILTFQFSGCLNAVRRDIDKSDEEWEKSRKAIDKVLISGLYSSTKG
ncbi:MAG: TetR/AcrR family transcriptional regulator [Treponema sp.]|nr:TetR/AcrR family transcriptional regulator [Treponema sp.]